MITTFNVGFFNLLFYSLSLKDMDPLQNLTWIRLPIVWTAEAATQKKIEIANL